jgi:signal transduction histidine kinase
MLVIASSRAKAFVAGGWLVFAGVNAYLMYVEPGKETIPYHLIWASFALLYGLADWPMPGSVVAFSGITLVTGIPLVRHARAGYIGWEECSEIVLMAVIAGLLVWHVRRSLSAQHRLSELREIEQSRAHTRELASRFGSHELRTRLTIARSLIDLIRTTADSDHVRDDADLAVTELDKALATATNLLTFVRFDGTPDRQPVSLDTMVGDIGRRWELRADRVWRFTSTPTTISGDPDRIEAALDCLLENAVKFTDRYDRIALDARTDGEDVVFTVEDSGEGIPEEDVGRVTALFETSASAGTRAGSGLGLAIVRAVAEARGGYVTTTSTQGLGTRVVIRTPRTPKPETAIVIAPTAGLPPVPAPRRSSAGNAR